MSQSPQVVVIGAGVSGLAATSRLLNSGFVNVTILEASNRVGGRVRSSIKFKDHGYIELGAQWVHGQYTNVAYKLANAQGFLDASKSEEDYEEKFSYESEGILNDNLEMKLWKKFQDIDNLFEDIEDQKPGVSVGDFVNEKLSTLPNR